MAGRLEPMTKPDVWSELRDELDRRHTEQAEAYRRRRDNRASLRAQLAAARTRGKAAHHARRTGDGDR